MSDIGLADYAEASFRQLVAYTWSLRFHFVRGTMSAPQILAQLYRWAAHYNPERAAAKVALVGPNFGGAMAACVNAMQGCQVVSQAQWTDVTAELPAFMAYYRPPGADSGAAAAAGTTGAAIAARAAAGTAPNTTSSAGAAASASAGAAAAAVPSATVAAHASAAIRTYLHVYSTRLPRVRGDWRIALNVPPESMATAIAALAPLLDLYGDIAHMKFLMPGVASKPDSVIIYLRRRPATYLTICQAAIGAVDRIALVDQLAAMVNRLAPGVAECAESPLGRMSFTEYRVLVVFMGLRKYVRKFPASLFSTNPGHAATAAAAAAAAGAATAAAAVPSLSGFEDYLTQRILPGCGLDPARPYLQGDRATDAAASGWWAALTDVHRAWNPSAYPAAPAAAAAGGAATNRSAASGPAAAGTAAPTAGAASTGAAAASTGGAATSSSATTGGTTGAAAAGPQGR